MNICISREFGSGGHDIGEQIAMQTGYRFLDRKLVEEAAERSGIAVERQHLYEKDAQTLVRKTDKRRKAYYNYYTEGGWGKPDNYDLCINSSREGIRKTEDVLRVFLEGRDREDDRKEI